MDEGVFTRSRLKDHFRRLWPVYLAGMILLCFLNHLVYTVTRPRLSDDEVLKVMLLNLESRISDAELDALSADLLAGIRDAAPNIEALEFELLAIGDDASSDMLLAVQLVGGYGDIYVADERGLDMLMKRNACIAREIALPEGGEAVLGADPESGEEFISAIRIPTQMFSGGEVYMAAAANTTDMESALTVLPVLAEAMMG